VSGFGSFDDFPVADTLDGGRYQPERLYLGAGFDQLFFGRSARCPGRRYLISTAPDNGLDVAELGLDLMRAAAGLFVPRFLGHFDVAGDDALRDSFRRDQCAFVEELPAGLPLRHAFPDPRSCALVLGSQVGRLLSQASRESGIFDIGLRPEYVWVELAEGAPVVTGLGGRNHAFLAAAARRRCLPTVPLFTHRYVAPEVYRGDPFDDRALVLTLALMVAEWATGSYPFPQDDGAWGYNRLCSGHPIHLPLPAPITRLLASALHPDCNHRPDLAAFTSALEAHAGSLANPRST